jgi:tRNA(fMet)-specific endonuclease VapC
LCRWPIERRFGEERTRKLENYLRNFVILPCDEAVARAWAALTPALKLRGVGFSHIDSWIAATALCHKLPLVTHNRKHFENIPGLRLIP